MSNVSAVNPIQTKTEQQQLEELRNAPEYKAYLQLQSDCPISREKITVKNVRILLKKTYPDVKFSVRKKYAGCIWVTWSYEIEEKHGLNQQVINKLVKPFQTSRFDAYDDYHWIQHTLFNKVYGGIGYIICQSS